MLDEGQRYKLIVGDSIHELEKLPRESFDMLATDPPYSSGGATRGDRMASTATKYQNSDSGNVGKQPDFEGDNRDQRSWGYWCTLWLATCLRLVKPGGVACVFVDWRQLPTMTDAIQAAGWLWRGLVPWDKTLGSSRPQRGRPRAQCEYVVFASRGPHAPYEGAPCLDGAFLGDCPGVEGFWRAMPPRERVHITEKPVALCRELARLAPPDGLILDCFAGSGSMGEGAILEGRRPVLIESSGDIAATAAERMAAACAEFRPDPKQCGLFD